MDQLDRSQAPSDVRPEHDPSSAATSERNPRAPAPAQAAPKPPNPGSLAGLFLEDLPLPLDREAELRRAAEETEAMAWLYRKKLEFLAKAIPRIVSRALWRELLRDDPELRAAAEQVGTYRPPGVLKHGRYLGHEQRVREARQRNAVLPEAILAHYEATGDPQDVTPAHEVIARLRADLGSECPSTTAIGMHLGRLGCKRVLLGSGRRRAWAGLRKRD